MTDMKVYNRVKFFHVEYAVENQLGTGKEATDILELCREAFRKKPTPFWHCASMLNARGYHAIVQEALSLGTDA